MNQELRQFWVEPGKQDEVKLSSEESLAQFSPAKCDDFIIIAYWTTGDN